MIVREIRVCSQLQYGRTAAVQKSQCSIINLFTTVVICSVLLHGEERATKRQQKYLHIYLLRAV
uniref:Uncharacterized protein n=1 Tax=Anguilla anguilla TaxID=7936 RepID=A0A0E9X6V2_ANGAN